MGKTRAELLPREREDKHVDNSFFIIIIDEEDSISSGQVPVDEMPYMLLLHSIYLLFLFIIFIL